MNNSKILPPKIDLARGAAGEENKGDSIQPKKAPLGGRMPVANMKRRQTIRMAMTGGED